MKFCMMGTRYKETPVSLREKVSFTNSQKIEFMNRLNKEGISQSVVLSTCNRSEAFFFLLDESKIEDCISLYVDFFQTESIKDYMIHKEGIEAIRYLYEVASGLESQVLGEDQILGQVVDAYEFSLAMGFTKKEINKVFQEAIACAKKIKTEYKISENALSISYVGIQALKNEELDNVLIIGSGKMADLALTHLKELNVNNIYLCNRTMEKLLNKMDTNINIVPFEKRYEIMHRCSCVISATSYPKYIIKEEKYLEQNYTIHHTFLDLALPRDIDEKLSNLHTVKIIDIDKLQSITDENYENRKKLANESRIMIDESINKLQHWLMTTNVDPTIQSIQDLCQKIVEDSYNYLDHKLSLDTRDKHLVKKVLEASLQRLLREPIREMKKIQDEDIQEEYIKVVQKLFQVDK